MVSKLPVSPWLLLALVILLAAKFLLQPLFEWQQTQIEQIQLKQRQLLKGASAIEQMPFNLAGKEQLSSQLAGYEGVVELQINLNQYMLEKQQELEKTFEELDLSRAKIDWKTPLEYQGDIFILPVELSVTGYLLDIIKLQRTVEKQSSLQRIVDFQVRFRRYSQGALPHATATMRVEMALKRRGDV